MNRERGGVVENIKSLTEEHKKINDRINLENPNKNTNFVTEICEKIKGKIEERQKPENIWGTPEYRKKMIITMATNGEAAQNDPKQIAKFREEREKAIRKERKRDNEIMKEMTARRLRITLH